MPPKKLTIFLFCLTVSLGPGFADTLILKDGSQIEGEIIDNGADAVVIEYFVTPTIKDQKTIPRENIAKVLAASDDDKAFVALGSLTSPANVQDTSFYDSLIDKKIPEFISKYPYTSHITELREDLRALAAERERVRQGDRKINGAWITASQIAADPYQIDAKIKFSEIQQSARSNNPVEALKEYELFEASYPASRVMPEAIDLALSQLNVLQGQVSVASDNFVILDARRQQTIASSPADQAQQIKDALESENQAAKAAMDKASQDGSKFFPIFPNSKDALDELQSLVTGEKQRLALLQAIPMRDSLGATESASQLIAQGKLKEAQEQLDLAARQWPANAEIATLRKKLQDAVKAAAATPAR